MVLSDKLYGSVYTRVGLKFNPFASLSSEGIPSVEDVHVPLPVDKTIIGKVEKLLKGQTEKLVMAIVGPLGMGKTERLRLIQNYVKRAGGKAVLVKVDSPDIESVTESIISSVLSAKPGKAFLSMLKAAFKRKEEEGGKLEERYKPEKYAETLSWVVSGSKGFLLLLDELENVMPAPMTHRKLFFSFLSKFLELMPPFNGVVFACITDAFNTLKLLHKEFIKHLTDEIHLNPLSTDECVKIVVKRIEKARVNGFKAKDPLYPFELEAIHVANKLAGGNPREFVKILKLALSSMVTSPNVSVIDREYILTLMGHKKL